MHEVTHYDITHSLSNYNINVIYVQSNGHNLEYLQVLKNNKGWINKWKNTYFSKKYSA